MTQNYLILQNNVSAQYMTRPSETWRPAGTSADMSADSDDHGAQCTAPRHQCLLYNTTNISTDQFQ